MVEEQHEAPAKTDDERDAESPLATATQRDETGVPGGSFALGDLDDLFASLVRRSRTAFVWSSAISLLFVGLTVGLFVNGEHVTGEATADLAVLVVFVVGTIWQGVRLRKLTRLQREVRDSFTRSRERRD